MKNDIEDGRKRVKRVMLSNCYDIMIFQKPGTLENTAFPAFSVSNLLLV